MSRPGRFRRDRRGFTLLEMVLATALAGLLLLAVLQLWETGMKGWLRAERRVDTAEGIQMALDRMVREVREAREIKAPAPGENPANRLQIVSGRDGSTITYYTGGLHAGWMYRRVGNSTGQPIAEKVKEFQVVAHSDGGEGQAAQRVEITLVGEVPGLPDVVLTTSVRLQVEDEP